MAGCDGIPGIKAVTVGIRQGSAGNFGNLQGGIIAVGITDAETGKGKGNGAIGNANVKGSCAQGGGTVDGGDADIVLGIIGAAAGLHLKVSARCHHTARGDRASRV